MKTWFHSWRAAIRIARRDAWRSKGRSALVLAMIALPILGVSALDLTYRSSELSPAERADRMIGAADARFKDPGFAGVPVFQDPVGEMNTPAKDYRDTTWPSGPADVTKTFPAGATVLKDTLGTAKLTTVHGLLSTEVRELKASDPAARGIMPLLEGRYPEKNDEVMATSHFLEASGLTIGSTVSARNFDRPYRIVGSYELPDALETDQVNLLPGAFLDAYAKVAEKAGLTSPGASTTYLVSASGGFTWNMVKELNAKGVVVTSRAVLFDPPDRSEVPLFQKEGWGGFEASAGATAADLAAVGTVVGLAMLEITRPSERLTRKSSSPTPPGWRSTASPALRAIAAARPSTGSPVTWWESSQSAMAEMFEMASPMPERTKRTGASLITSRSMTRAIGVGTP